MFEGFETVIGGGFSNRQKLAGLALAGLGAAMLVVGLTSRGGAAAAGQGLTIPLPAAAHDKIYGAATARGRPIVVLDAGHGGSDPGAKDATGQISEKDLTLIFARELRDALVQRGRVRVAMTRDGDNYIGLDDRSAVARRLNSALFVSLHMDSAANPEARGASVYSLSDVASDAESARLATVENRGAADSGTAGESLRSILADLAMRSQMTASADLAATLVAKAAGRIELRPQPHRFAAFHVLRRADTPAVLFEAGYLSNSADEALLRTPAYRHSVVVALAEAIESGVAARSAR